jgi:hypothetical protein
MARYQQGQLMRRRRLFPERRYRLPLKWVLLGTMAAFIVLMIWVMRKLFA